MSLSPAGVQVAGAAIVVHGRVLAARRAAPPDVRGGWELPGGKIDPDESAADAVAREVREELGCEVAYVRPLRGSAPIKPGYELTAHLVGLASGEPVPHEHDVLRWLAVEDLDDVSWLPADRPFLDELRTELARGFTMSGGNVGGAVRVGRTVRRAAGPWTPAVHALLEHVRASGLAEAPRLLGADAEGREALEYLPGEVNGQDASDEPPPDDGLVVDAVRWLRRYHDEVSGFWHPGPWRNHPGAAYPGAGEIVCHHDFAPYNVASSTSAEGQRVVGVFDWDMSGPGTRLQDLAFAAWNWVPMWRAMPAEVAAMRLRLLADAYGGPARDGPSARDVLDAVAPRIERSIAVIRAGQAAGDPGMLNLANVGEPARTVASLADMVTRVPAIAAFLGD